MIEVIKDPLVPQFKRATEGSIGYDLYNIGGDIELQPMQTVLVHTGIKLNMTNEFFYALVLPRSGLSLKTNLRVCNAPGLIDVDYLGEICVIMQNIHPTKVEKINQLDRVAQLVFQRQALLVNESFKFVDKFSDSTERGAGGFGSTGK